jgi:hypothetical protein
MEDILEVYRLPYDPNIPMICMDEQPYQFLGEKREPILMKQGKTAKEDYEYTREGTCSIFMFTEPLGGWRHVHASVRRTKREWALRIRELLEEYYPNVPKVRLVMDNLNTHAVSSLYETFAPDIALRLSKRLEIHCTPKHGSWLNIAEIELSAMTKQCLGKRIATIEELQTQISAWENKRNADTKSVDWQFSTDNARVKLKWLYPKI